MEDPGAAVLGLCAPLIVIVLSLATEAFTWAFELP